MITTLLVVMFITALIQPDDSSRNKAALFVGLTITFDLLSGFIPHNFYFLSAGINDLLILALLATMSKSWMSVGLAQVCILSIFTNFIGWILWDNSLLAGFYGFMFVLIYSYAIYVMLRTEKHGNTIDFGWFHTAFSHSLEFIYQNKTKFQ